LLAGTLHSAAPARPTQIWPTITAADAFDALGFECLRHVASNEAAVCHSDPEGIHQMRVGLRRLRAALSIFKDMLNGRETAELKASLTWLTDQLGPARDYDVFVSQTIVPLLEQHPELRELRLLASDFKAERDKGYAKAKAAVASERYRLVVLDTALWLLDGEWRTNPDGLATALRHRPLSPLLRTN